MDILVDITIITIYVILALAVVSVVWSMFDGWRKRSEVIPEERMARRTSIAVVILAVVVVAVSLLFSSGEPMRIAGQMYTDTIWLHIADICMYSLLAFLILFFVAAVAMLCVDGRNRKPATRKPLIKK